jgi:NADH:ubiquinone oxidoreductase subunit E
MTQAGALDQAGTPGREAVEPQDVLRILAKHGTDRGELIAVLEEIQARYGYLPEEVLRKVSEETGLSLVDVYGIATFYRAFSLVPRGKHLVCACLGTACHVRGAPRVVEELERRLGVQSGQTTPDGEFTLETVNCLGACALGPVVVIDGRYFSKVSKSKVRQLLSEASAGLGKAGTGEAEGTFPIETSCPRCNHGLMDADFPIDGLPSIRCSISIDQQHGWVRLSSLYGSKSVLAEHDIVKGTVVSFFCPHCHARMEGNSTCSDCEAPMVPMMIRGGGVVQICSRRGCENRVLELT